MFSFAYAYIVLWHLPPQQSNSCQRSHLHASETPFWLLWAHCRRGWSQGPGGVLVEVLKRIWLLVDPGARPGNWSHLTTNSHPWNGYSTCLSWSQKLPPKTQPWDSDVLSRHLEGIEDKTPLWSFVILLRFDRGCGDLLVSRPPKTGLAYKLPCLLNMPPFDL